jgi:hypothetical protein
VDISINQPAKVTKERKSCLIKNRLSSKDVSHIHLVSSNPQRENERRITDEYEYMRHQVPIVTTNTLNDGTKKIKEKPFHRECF